MEMIFSIKTILKFAVVVTSIVIMGCNQKSPERDIEIKQNKVGRFQLMQLGTFRRDQYLIDTESGNIWRSVCLYSSKHATPSDCTYEAFQTVDVIGVNTTNEQAQAVADFYKSREARK